jgi:hypothetical protein
MNKWCCECRAGEHDNYDEDVRLAVVRDPDSNRFKVRGYLCSDHRTMFRDDGYIVTLTPKGA